MKRSLAWTAAFSGMVVMLCGVVDATAATKRKRPVDSAEAATSQAPRATPPLDLPLPAKAGGNEPKGGAPEKKVEAGEASSPAKGPQKAEPDSKTGGEHAPNATVEPEEILEFAAQPPRIQQLIRDAVNLTRLNLTYTFSSADPDAGGMDCSGTIYYLLHAHSFGDVPRDSAGQYLWARRGGGFFPVVSKDAESAEFKELLPGDLMFWNGTYETGRDIPISHVMMYLGREKGTRKRIMFGASDGRSYHGIQRWGVSVFDFEMPKANPAKPESAKVDFVGFARIPGLRFAAPPLQLADQDAEDGAKKDMAGADRKAAAPATPGPAKKKPGPTPHRKKKKTPADD